MSSSMQKNLRRLVEAIYQNSISGSINWSYNEPADICEAELGKGFIQVLTDTDEDGDYYNYIRILNSDKQVVDTIYGGTLGSLGSTAAPSTGHANYWQMIADLKSVAHRSAVGANDVINSMLTAMNAHDNLLSEDDNIPF